MSWTTTFTIFAATAALIATAGGAASAQTASQRGDTIPSAKVVVPNGTSFLAANPSRGYTGIGVSGTPTMGQDGRLRWTHYPTIWRVAAGSPGEMAGLAVGDTVLSVNGTDAHVPKLLYVNKIGDTFLIRIRRGDGLHDYTIVSVANPGVK